MTGTRLLLTLLLELRRRGLRRGLAAACIGGGQGIAAIVETRAERRSRSTPFYFISHQTTCGLLP